MNRRIKHLCLLAGMCCAFAAHAREPASDSVQAAAKLAEIRARIESLTSRMHDELKEEGIVNNRCPITNFYETLSMCAFLVVAVFLAVYLRYRVVR